MALFKILSNMDDTSKSLPSNYVKGYCYFNVNDGKFWVDTKDGDSSGRVALNAVKADELTTVSAGATNKPIYWVNGKPAAISGTIGGTTTPVYINSGTITACSGTVGSTNQPVFLNGGTITALNTTIGNASTPVYLDKGVITACTDIQTVGLTHIGSVEPTSTNYVLWVDEDEDAATAMPNDAIKYKTFNIETSAWSGSGPYTYSMTATGVTANTAIINLTLDAASQTYQKAQLDWETGTNIITLSTATIPTGTLAGYLIAVEVTEI